MTLLKPLPCRLLLPPTTTIHPTPTHTHARKKPIPARHVRRLPLDALPRRAAVQRLPAERLLRPPRVPGHDVLAVVVRVEAGGPRVLQVLGSERDVPRVCGGGGYLRLVRRRDGDVAARTAVAEGVVGRGRLMMMMMMRRRRRKRKRMGVRRGS